MSNQDRTPKRKFTPSTKPSLMQEVFSGVPALVAAYNINTGQYIYINDAVQDLLGYGTEKFLDGGLDFVISIVHPDDLQHLLADNQAALEKANKHPKERLVLTAEYRMKHADGSWRWFHTDGTIMDRDVEGNVQHVMNVSVDITNRRNAEEWTKHALKQEIQRRDHHEKELSEAQKHAESANRKIAASEERYQSFVRNSSEGIWRFELEQPIPVERKADEQIELMYKYGYLAEANHAMAHMYGLESPEELIGARLGDLLIRTDPKNIEYLRAFIKSGYKLSGVESHERDTHGNDKYFRNSLVGMTVDGLLVRAWGTQQDITEQHLANQALAESQQRLNLTINAAKIGTWEWNLETNELTWSDELKEIYKLNKSTPVTYDTVTKYNHPDDSPRILDAMQKAIKTKKPYRIEYRIITKDKKTHWVAAYGQVFHHEDQPARMLGTVVKIDEQKRHEAELVKAQQAAEEAGARIALSEQRLHLALKASKVGIWEWNIISNKLMWSDQLKKIYNIPKDTPIDYALYLSRLHPSDREKMHKIVESSQKTGKSYRVEHRIVWPDGSIHWVLGQGKAVMKDGKAVRMIGTSMDIDDRKHAEGMLRNRLNLQNSIAELGQLALSNPQLSKLMDKAVEHLQANLAVDFAKILERLPDGKRLILRAGLGWDKHIIINESTVSGGLHSQAGYTLISNLPVIVKNLLNEKRFNGPELLRSHNVTSGMSVIIHGPGSPYGVLGVHTKHARNFTVDDISYLQSIANIIGLVIQQQELSAESMQLKALNRAKDEFISVASHHLRTPATAVKMYIGLLQEGYAGSLTDDQNEYLTQAYESNEQQLQVIDDLLNVAEVDTMQVVMKIKHENIVRIIDDVLLNLSAKFGGRKQTVKFNRPPTPIQAPIDVIKMHLVVENIIGNASKYSPEGEEIRIDVRVKEQKVYIAVTDRGTGIDKDDVRKIFDKFARVKNEAYISESGTGLGLYWAKKIVELHDGSITVQTKPGKGSTFTLMLPIIK